MGRVVPGPGERAVPFQPVQRRLGRVYQRLLDVVGLLVQLRGPAVAAAFPCLPRGHPVGGVQYRYRFRGGDREVEVRHPVRVARARGRADLGQLDGARERMLSQVRRDRGVLPLAGSPGLTVPGQRLPAGADVVLIQALDHVGIHLAGETEPGGCLPGPLPGRLPSRGVVGHRADAPATALSAGEVGNVVPRVECRRSCHG
jgi:hypothetical protein